VTATDVHPPPARSIQMYLLAADADRAVCEAIVKHLKPVVREFAVPIQLLNDFDVPPGSEVQAHKARLLTADIVLALSSADFINDDAIYSRVKAVTELHNSGKVVMIPLLVRNCLWKATPFARLGMLPRNFQPLNNLQFWPSTDDALMAVVSDVYAALNAMTQKAGGLVAPLPAGAMPAAADAPPAPAAPAPLLQAGAGAEVHDMTVDWRRDYYRKIVWKRAAALGIDWVVAFLVWMVWLMFYMASSGDMSSQWDDSDLAVMLVIFYIGCPLLEASPWRATVGKRVMGLQITDQDGRRISFGRAFLRTVLRTVVGYAYVLSLGVLLVVQYLRFQKTRKLFHDELSSTLIGERLAQPKLTPQAVATA
jgi:uncharacterized RDD family membrane protein YckC